MIRNAFFQCMSLYQRLFLYCISGVNACCTNRFVTNSHHDIIKFVLMCRNPDDSLAVYIIVFDLYRRIDICNNCQGNFPTYGFRTWLQVHKMSETISQLDSNRPRLLFCSVLAVWSCDQL